MCNLSIVNEINWVRICASHAMIIVSNIKHLKAAFSGELAKYTFSCFILKFMPNWFPCLTKFYVFCNYTKSNLWFSLCLKFLHDKPWNESFLFSQGKRISFSINIISYFSSFLICGSGAERNLQKIQMVFVTSHFICFPFSALSLLSVILKS